MRRNAVGRARDLEDLLHVGSKALADLFSQARARAAADTSQEGVGEAGTSIAQHTCRSPRSSRLQ